ncbi:MAG: methyl-accepting chemotaxis protein [bacterium]
MQWFKNFKISQKILAFVAMATLFICIVGYVGFHFTTKGANDMTAIYKDRALPMMWMYDAVGNVNNIEALINEINATSDKNTQKAMYDEIVANREDNNKILAEYEKTKLDPFELKTLAELKNNLQEYSVVQTKTIDMGMNGNRNEAEKYFLSNIDAAQKVGDNFKALADYNAKVAKELNTQNDKDAAEAVALIIGIIVVAVVLAVSIGLMIASIISKPINAVVENLNEVAKGNLAIDEVHNDSNDETGILAKSLNLTVKNLRALIGTVSKSIEEISANSEEMSASSEQTAQGAQQTATSTQQLAQGAQEISRNVELGATSINGLNKTIQGVALEAGVVAKLGNDTETNANVGAEHVKKAVLKIDSIKNVAGAISINIAELGKLSSDIEQIVDLIKNIAGQTNLLALNAAIEAARAGEHGKGFAVVADEVKKLAGQSAGATEKITAMIKEIQNKTHIAVNTMDKATKEVEEGVFVINDAGKALDNIISQVKQANNKIQGITKDIDGVAVSSEEVLRMVENISAITEETAASAEEISSITEEQTASLEEISASSQTLAKVAEDLQKQVSVFKI